MLRATTVTRRLAVKAAQVIDTVTLDHEDRNRRRIALKGETGTEILLDLDKATVLNDGDALKLEDGRLIRVAAAPERLMEIRAENPLRLLTIAWHIGNRHAPAEITADAIYIAHDHVLAEMVRGQGCSLIEVMRSFQPQRGAYDHGHEHGPDCGHDHEKHASHDHAEHDHANHAHSNTQKHEAVSHTHAADCGCGHNHSHEHDNGHKSTHDHNHKHDH